MAHVETLKDVPNAKVPAIQTSYEGEGATVIGRSRRRPFDARRDIPG